MHSEAGYTITPSPRALLLMIIFISSVLVHLAFIFTVHLKSRSYRFREKSGIETFHVKVVGNEVEVVKIADNLYRNYFFSIDGKSPTAYYVPLLPVIIALMFNFTNNLVCFMVITCFIISFIALATYKLSTLFFSTESSLITMAAVAFAPFTFDSFLNIVGDPYNSLFIILSLYFFVLLTRQPKYHYAAFCGILCGLAVLARAESVLILPIYFLYLIYQQLFKKKKLFSFTLAFLFVSCLTLSPWVIRNQVSLGFSGLSTSSGEAFAGAHNKRVLQRHPGSWQGYWLYLPPQEAEMVSKMNEVQSNRYKWERGWKVLSEYSIFYIMYVELRKLLNTFKPSFRTLPKEYNPVLNLILVAPYFILYILFFIYLGKFIKDYGILLLPFLIPLGVTLVFWGGLRWRVPFEPILFCLIIGYLVDYKWHRHVAAAS
jgi:hypothetical protein